MNELKVQDLVLMAFYVAMFMVLDTLTNTVGFLSLPNGGSLGVSVIPLLMASYQLGWKQGLAVAVISVFAQFVTGPMYTPNLIGFALDYLLAFGAYGLAVMFPNYGMFYSGVVITNLMRFLSSVLSGVVVWQTPLLASISYNATYMLPTLILTVIVIPVIMKVLEPRLRRIQRIR